MEGLQNAPPVPLPVGVGGVLESEQGMAEGGLPEGAPGRLAGGAVSLHADS